jgi:spermidine synthase
LKAIPILFFFSGLTALIYEIVWIRLFSIAFGQTSPALATVLAVYLGGLALGSWVAGKIAPLNPVRCLSWYGAAEVLTGVYALATPLLIQATQPFLKMVYSSGVTQVGVVRALLCSAVLLPVTVLIGASLPLLAGHEQHQGPRSIQSLYAINLAGASLGALSSLALLPSGGFQHALQSACVLSFVVGLSAVWIARSGADRRLLRSTQPRVDDSRSPAALATGVWVAAAFTSGVICMLHEVAWARVYGLLLGPTVSTVTLVLSVFLVGLTAGAVTARRLDHPRVWLCGTQFASAVLLLWTSWAAGALPDRIAEWLRRHNQSAGQIELMKALVLAVTLLPLTTAVGLSFPVMLRLAPARDFRFARQIGGVYGINTAGCITGALAAGWLLIPALGTQTTVLLGGLLSIALGILLFFQPAIQVAETIGPRRRNLRQTTNANGLPHRVAIAATCVVLAIAALFLPRWNMSAMAAGAYKYAPYYADSAPTWAAPGVSLFLHEGVSGTVAVRQAGASRILSIDGKVDASDAGGDLLTEKLLAHIPLLLKGDAANVCLIGLASGVTAGAVLTHPVKSLDVVELSPDVVRASHFFDGVNRNALADPRTALLVNDGRNHLALTSRLYDVIVSEPSNPWMAGMNSLFTRDFFRIARQRLRPGGILAQWFHIYNMPKDDLQSWLRAFVEVFPSSMLWRLNDGDVLMTGFVEGAPQEAAFSTIPPITASDLAAVGVSDARLLLNLYVMSDGDLQRFAGSVPPNTDDNSILEFHGQRDLHAQTDVANSNDLDNFVRELPPPAAVQTYRNGLDSALRIAEAHMFERAESFRSAFRSYRAAFDMAPNGDAKSLEALAGMDRTARVPEERTAVALGLDLPAGEDNLETRTERALEKARRGDLKGAQFLFQENAEAHPSDSAAHLNYGIFRLERSDYTGAIDQFKNAIDLNPTYLPAYEAMAEVYLQLHDIPNAMSWSRRILQINPDHQVARRTLQALEAAHTR